MGKLRAILPHCVAALAIVLLAGCATGFDATMQKAANPGDKGMVGFRQYWSFFGLKLPCLASGDVSVNYDELSITAKVTEMPSLEFDTLIDLD